MKLDIVTHSHNYSRCLAYQLSSLVLFPPKTVDVTFYLYHTPDDQAALNTIEHFKGKMPCEFVTRSPELGYLYNRAIGRNEVAQATNADWVWFTDADYLFRRDCLDDLNHVVNRRFGENPEVNMVHPLNVLVSEQDVGDRYIAEMNQPEVKDIVESDFSAMQMLRGIGGIQIAPGKTCREVGYVPWMKKKLTNWNFHSDMRFRRSCVVRHSIDLCHIYRLRHSIRGYSHPGAAL